MPVSLFGAVMGLCGLSFVWGMAHKLWQVNIWISHSIGLIAILSFFVISFVYLIKLIKYPRFVYNDFNHPVTISFFAMIIISFLLIHCLLMPYNMPLAIGS